MARNKYPEETKNLIIETSMKLFMEKGYDHTSIQDIIENLGGLSKGAIYHHFKSKEEIMWAVADHIYIDSDKRMMEICDREDLTGREKLARLFHASLFSPALDDLCNVAPDLLKNSQFLAIYIREVVQKEAPAFVRKILEEGIRDGSIQTDYPRELAEVMMLMGDIWLNPMVYHCEPFETIKKMKFFQHMMRLLGLDVIDDAMIERLESITETYQKSKKG